MIICCYTEISRQWNEQELTDKLMLLPSDLRQAALRKRQWIDRQLSIAGILLLSEALKKLGGDNLFSPDDIKYSTHHRPYLEGAIDFNIAHSGNMVVCCATDNGKIGVDIEQIKEIDLADYTDYFTANEWSRINNYPNRFDGFYNFWTRKEAVLKAIGTGFHTPLSSVDVSADEITYDDVTYYIRSLDIVPGYKSNIASTTGHADVQLIALNL